MSSPQAHKPELEAIRRKNVFLVTKSGGSLGVKWLTSLDTSLTPTPSQGCSTMPQGGGRNNKRLSVRGIVAMLDSGGTKIVTQAWDTIEASQVPMEPHQ